jgi:putative MATE family efflux protein
VWREVVRAFRGAPCDYTSESPRRAVFLLALPMVLEMFMESLFVVADLYWVARLGHVAVAAVGLTESVMSIAYAVAIGISFAATAMVARRVGEQDRERASRSAAQIVLLGFAISAALGLLAGYFAPDILRLMGASEAVVTVGQDFSRIMLGGNVTAFMLFVVNAIFRGAGDAVYAMRALWLANAMNIVLGPLLIFGWGPFPELGLTGAAVATNIGRGIGLTYQLANLVGGRGTLRVRLHHFRLAPDILKTIAATAGPGVAQLMIGMTSFLGVFKILSTFGSAALAGYTITVRIVSFALLPALGLANAGATLVGQNLGALLPERADAAVRLAARLNVVTLGVVGIALIVCSKPLISLFAADRDVVFFGAWALGVIALAFPFIAAGMCFSAAFNSAGDTWTPTRLNIVCLWLGQVPLAWVLAHSAGLGAVGVFIAIAVSRCAFAVWSYALFSKGSWKLRII